MRLICLLLAVTGSALAQEKVQEESLPAPAMPNAMPTARPMAGFYRNPKNPKNVIRSTVDNMPVKTPDSSQTYSILSAPALPKSRKQPLPKSSPVIPAIPK
ncbi:hypothetical protein [Arsenicibacter rosenii]|nr:hypothetical protein [Arsenicibacter rosenii]